jgi:hypothetical protein
VPCTASLSSFSQVLNARSTPSLGETVHVEHVPAVLVRQEPVRARRNALERLGALANSALRLARTEVHAHPTQSLAGRPGPLAGRVGDYVHVTEGLVVLRACRHKLKGIRFGKRIGPGHQEMVPDLALSIRLSKSRVPG